MVERRKQQLRMNGLDPELIETLSIECVKYMQEKDISLREAKVIVNTMSDIISESEKHRPETKLKDITLRREGE